LTPTIARWVQSPSLLPLACCGEPSCSDAFPTRRSSDLDYENYRIGFVEMRAIAGANTGYRKLSFSIEIDGDVLLPAANDIRDVHGYGARYSLWYGELNPATGLPWTPADIVNFDIGGNSVLKVRSQTATATHFPKLFAMRLVVWVAPETRKAVGVWRRPHTLATRLNNITTDALISVPDG